MKKFKYIYILSLFCFLQLSCSDENTNNEQVQNENSISSFEDYFSFINSETTGAIIVQSIKTPLSNEMYMASSSIEGNKTPLMLKVDEQVVTFTNYQYSESSNVSSSNESIDDMSTLFGNNFEVVIENEQVNASRTNQTSSNSVESVYIPALISATFSGLDNGRIVAGSQISWNFDGNNNNGVVIGFEYNPLSQVDEEVINQQPTRQLSGTTVTDNGSYTITSEDLQAFPSYAMMTFYIGRAGYNITNDNLGNDYALAGLTVSRTDLQIVR